MSEHEVYMMLDENEITNVVDAYYKGQADALNIDMEKPMCFTDEQKAWIKNYVIINAKRQRAEAIDDFVREIKSADYVGEEDYLLQDCDAVLIDTVEYIAEKLKEQNDE